MAVSATQAVVLATCAPINKDPTIHARQSPWRSYVAGLAIPKAASTPAHAAATPAAPPPAAQRACWWTVDEAEYKYVRLAVDETPGATGDILVVGGEDHEAAQAPPLAAEPAGGGGAGDAWARLEAWARARWPRAGDLVYKRIGIVNEPADGLGLVGWSPVDAGGRVFVVTGDSGQGFTNAAIGALAAAAEIAGAPAPAWLAAFSPRRHMAAAAPRLTLPGLAHEALATAKGLSSRALKPSLTDIEALGPGCGGVGQAGLTGRVAAFVDDDGRRHTMAGVCPHMGCTLAFNPRERTFDCPCHGSTFDCHGVCIQAPATLDLAPVGGGARAAEE